jgi:hypothetical protein
MKRRVVDNYTLRRRAELLERRRAGIVPKPAPPKPVSRRQMLPKHAEALLDKLAGLTEPRAPLTVRARWERWTLQQDRALCRAIAQGLGVPASLKYIRAFRPRATEGACRHRFGKLCADWGLIAQDKANDDANAD